MLMYEHHYMQCVQSTRMPAVLITFAHFTISLCMNRVNSYGEVGVALIDDGKITTGFFGICNVELLWD
jgi:hypothetical protein